jgi:hypothetical protein
MATSWNGLSDQDLKLIDGWCDQFEERWNQGKCPVIETIVRSAPPPLQDPLCCELALLEFDLRQNRGETPSFDEYARRFPHIGDKFKQREWDQVAAEGPASRGACPVELNIGRTSIPRQIAQYQILETIGTSSVGVMVRALDPKLRRIVAAVVLHPDLACRQQSRSEFLSAARAVATVSDPHVATVFETFECNDVVCQFQEYIVGQSLAAHLQKEIRPTPTEIARIGWQVASGLASAHRQGVIHGNLTPESLILENGLPRIKIVGFGMARVRDGVPVGLLEAPSQQSDLFQLGCILHRLCSGKEGATNFAELAPVRELNPRIPEWLATAVHRLLDRDSDGRFTSAEAAAAELSAGLATPVSSEPAQHARIDLPVIGPAPQPQQKRSARLWLAVGLAAVALGVCVWAWRNWG